MKKFIAIAFMAVIATASFAQDAAAPKAKKAKKVKATTATNTSKGATTKAATTAAPSSVAGWGNSPAAAPAKPAAAATKPAMAEAKPVAAPVAAAPAVKASKAKMDFASDVMDYGTIKKGSERVRKFSFKNTGTEPLIISNATGSCGCTVPTYPHEPIMPGASATIDVNYDTNRLGAFTKTVTLTTNAEGQESKLLTIKGTVEDTAAPAGVTAPVQGGH
jgi:hypothetical protein